MINLLNWQADIVPKFKIMMLISTDVSIFVYHVIEY